MSEPSSKPLPPDEGRRQFIAWLWRIPVIAALGGAGYGIWQAYRIHFNKLEPTLPDFTDAPPQEVAPLSQLETLWAAQEFTYEGIPAVAIHLPEAIPGALSVDGQHYAAFSRVCTHQGCAVRLNRDLETLAVAFNFRTDHPALVCSCHLSAFAPLQAGKAVSGPAVKPLPRVRLGLEQTTLYATGIENT